jgi:PAS domain S-box-containing protein
LEGRLILTYKLNMSAPDPEPPNHASLIKEIEQLRARLDEAEQTLQAIHHGEVDAVIVAGPQGDRVYSLAGADHVYRIIVETMYEAAITVDLEGTILFCNQRFCDLLQTPMQQVVGQKLTGFVAVPQQELWRTLLTDAQAAPVQRRLVLRAADGTDVPLQVSASLLAFAGDTRICLVAADLKQLEAKANSIKVLREHEQALEAQQAELRRQREWFRITLSSIGDAVIATDAEARVSLINPVAETLTGWSAAEALGQPVQKVFTVINERTRCPVDVLVTGVMGISRVVGLGTQSALLTKDGREIPIEDCAAPIRDREGIVCGVVLVFHDVSAKRRTDEELRNSHAELARFNQAMVGRELRMVELKQEVNALCAKAGHPPRYRLDLDPSQP